MQGVAGGAHAVATARGVIDHTGGVRTCRQQTKPLPQAQRAAGTDDRRDTGQRHVVTDVQVRTHADSTHVLGQAQAKDLDVVGIGQLIGGGVQRIEGVDHRWHLPRRAGAVRVGRGNAPGVQIGLRQDFRGFAVVNAEGAIQPGRRPFGHDAPVAAVMRRQVLTATHVGQTVAWRQATTQRTALNPVVGVAQQERLRTEADQVGTTVIRAGFRQTRSIPIQEVLGTHGQFRIDGERHRQLVTRYKQFFGFGTRRRGQFGQVEAGLAVADRMHRVENGLAPEHVVLAGLGAEHRLFTDFSAVEHEGVEDFTRRTGVVTRGIVAQVRAAIADVVIDDPGQAWIVGDQARTCIVAVDERVGIGADVLIGLVVPAGGADAKAHGVFEDHIHLGQQVDAIGDVGPGLAEVVVAVVVVRRCQHALVGAFSANTVVVLDGVIHAYVPVRVARIDLDRMGRRHGCRENGRSQQGIAWSGEAVTLIVVHCVVSAFLSLF
ncbi:hypothetical protein D3C84_440050 [compost metagenome]